MNRCDRCRNTEPLVNFSKLGLFESILCSNCRNDWNEFCLSDENMNRSLTIVEHAIAYCSAANENPNLLDELSNVVATGKKADLYLFKRAKEFVANGKSVRINT